MTLKEHEPDRANRTPPGEIDDGVSFLQQPFTMKDLPERVCAALDAQ